MKIGLVGPSYQMRSINFDAQRCVNLFPVISEAPADPSGKSGSKEVEALFATPGLVLEYSGIGVGPLRGGIACGNGRSFVLSGNGFYELNDDGTTTSKGTVSTYKGTASLEENGQQVFVATGDDGYVFDFAESEELVTNGTFAADASWTKGAGWTISAGVANAAGAISTSLSQVIGVVNQISYQVVYTITRAAGSITPNLGGTAGTTRSAAGTYTETIAAGSSGAGLVFTTSGFTGTVDNVSVKQVTDQFVHVTDTDFPGADYVTFQDGFFIVNRPDTGQFFISDSYNGLSWDALNFATAETSPDNLVAPFSAYGNLWLFGEKTTEVWYNAGDPLFPYARAQGGKMETGCAARFSIAKADNSIFWVGSDANGHGIVYRAQGFQPMRISTQAIEFKLAESGDLTDLIGFCYQQEGHLFYVLTGGNLESSFVYDASTNMWHERANLNDGELEQWLAVFHIFAFNKNLVGDRTTGKIYSLDLDAYSDNGNEIKRTRTFTHLNNEGKRFTVNYLQVDFEYGVGNDEAPDPVATLRFSKDYGHTWSAEYQVELGAIGEYRKRAIWRRLGTFTNCTFEVTVSDPVKVAICGAYIG